MAMRSFEVRLADELGLSAAVVYGRLCDLCQEKARKNADYHDGFFWVRLRYRDFLRVFPFLSESTVSKAIKKLREEGLVRVGHYDENGGSANWYTVI